MMMMNTSTNFVTLNVDLDINRYGEILSIPFMIHSINYLQDLCVIYFLSPDIISLYKFWTSVITCFDS